jgi:hypothetical protein
LSNTVPTLSKLSVMLRGTEERACVVIRTNAGT